MDERIVFRPVVKPIDAEFHNRIHATKVLVFLFGLIQATAGGLLDSFVRLIAGVIIILIIIKTN